MIKEILKKSRDTKEIIAIRLYDGDEDFWCGYIENFNDNIIQLRHFDKHGNDDGIIIEQIEHIESIDFDSEYEKTFNYITRLKNNFDHFEIITDFKDSDIWRFEYLKDSKDRHRIISLEFNQDYVIYGIILDLNDNEFMLQGIGKLGEEEGKTIYKIDDISAFKIMDNACRFRTELNKWRIKTSG
jgi:hypothetical protein